MVATGPEASYLSCRAVTSTALPFMPMVPRTAAVDTPRPTTGGSLGIALGCVVWGTAVPLGLGTLLRASEIAYTVVKFCGAGYLLRLGAKALLARRVAALGRVNAHGMSAPNGVEGFRRSVLTNPLDSKVGVFSIAFLPQFPPARVTVAAYPSFLASTHILLTLAWFGFPIAATAPLTGLPCRLWSVNALD